MDKHNVSLDSDDKPIWQLAISFIIGAGVSIVTVIIFGVDYSFTINELTIPVFLAGFGISIGISFILLIWVGGRIRSNRLVGSIGHVILYSIFSGIIQKLIF